MSKSTIALAVAALLSVSAHATLVTTDVGYTGPTLKLGAYANGSYNFTFGPAVLPGGITFTRSTDTDSNSGLGGVIGQGFYGLADNGSFGGDAVYTGLDGSAGNIVFTLDAPVSSFGVFVNYAPGFGSDPTISALDSFGNVIDSYDLATLAPVSTPGGFNEFAFRGISESTTSIYALVLSNSYILASGTATGDVVPSIPEPETYALMLVGLGSIGAIVRQRRSTTRNQ